MRPARSLKVFEGTGPGEIGEDSAQGMIGLEAAGLTGFDEAIQVGGGLRAGHTVMEEPVAATHAKGSQTVLGRIVVDRDAPVGEIQDELVPFVGEIAKGFAQGALRQDAGAVGIKPGPERVPHRPGMDLPVALSLFKAHGARLLLDPIERLDLDERLLGQAFLSVLAPLPAAWLVGFDDLVKFSAAMGVIWSSR